MKAADLRKSILQAAVQGKLVPQDKCDEPASELLKRIQADKTVLIKEGKLKKEKPLPPITDDENSCNLPEGWVWCRLGDITTISRGASPRPKGDPRYWDENNRTPYHWIKISDISKYTKYDVLYDTDEFLTEEGKELSVYVDADFVITAASGSIGKSALLGINGYIYDGLIALKIYDDTVNKRYLISFISATASHLVDESTGTSWKNIRTDTLKTIYFPLPPLAEQQRIVAKVDELMALCDELEATEKELDTIETHFVEYLPKSILQAAVQGKLVPQDKNDEPASELLKRIMAEKATLIKDGKLKKEKPLPPITEDEIPYDLPEGWAWCRLGDIHQICRGITFPASVKKEQAANGNVRCATTGSVQHRYNPVADAFIPKEFVKRDDEWLQVNDIIMSTANSRELVGKTCIWDAYDRMTFGGFLTVIRTGKATIPFFSYYALQYFQKTGAFNISSTQTTNIANISNGILLNTLFPLPPLAEQKRIVAKVDELIALCDELKRVGEKPIDHSNLISFPADTEVDAAPLQMAAQGKVDGQPSKKHAAALDDLVEMMDNE